MSTPMQIESPDAVRDYLLSMSIDYALATPEGAGDRDRRTRARYEVSGEMRDGAWWLGVSRVLVADDAYGEHVTAGPEFTLDEQTGPDHPLALLGALLHGPLAHDGGWWVHGPAAPPSPSADGRTA